MLGKFIFMSFIIRRTLRSETIIAPESSLKMTENAFYFTLFILKAFKRLSWLFDHVEKQLDETDIVNFKICDFKTWKTSSCNINIAQYLTK